MNELLSKLRSIQLCLMAHPDNEPDSEFADRISDLEDLPKEIENALEKQRIEGVLNGLKICKEMWAQGTISHEEISENEIYYKEELSRLQGLTA
ncbi:MAG: hypothetical protein H3C36_02935 [Chitinophagaceae bacterium]|nr:hypothetical protein [Chitinophagaceae bacterium]